MWKAFEKFSRLYDACNQILFNNSSAISMDDSSRGVVYTKKANTDKLIGHAYEVKSAKDRVKLLASIDR